MPVESINAGYSPSISAELHLNGQIFDVAALGPMYVVLRNAYRVDAGHGTIRLTIDGQETVIRGNFFYGIDPAFSHQAYKPLD